MTFETLKQRLTSADVMSYYNQNAESNIIVDGSPFRLGPSFDNVCPKNFSCDLINSHVALLSVMFLSRNLCNTNRSVLSCCSWFATLAEPLRKLTRKEVK
jgi:hypothetical protein